LGDGTVRLVGDSFMGMIKTVADGSDLQFIAVIEEVNRSNSSQLISEMPIRLEAGKRTPIEALELSYRQLEDERVFISKTSR
jgi:5-methylcytosine-specific restriction protein B